MKAFLKNFFREIGSNKGRFISIIAIVMLSVGFLIGLLSSTPDFRYSVSTYYEENNVSDITLVSKIGFNDKSLEYINDNYSSYIESSDMIEQEDVISTYSNQNIATRVSYINNISDSSMNKLTLIEGKYPSMKSECVVERYNGYLEDIKVGDSIKIDGKDIKVSGIVSSPLYYAKSKETTSIGSGKLGAIVYFDASYESADDLTYTYIYLRFKNVERKNMFTDKYIDKIDTYQKELKNDKDSILSSRVEELDNKIYSEVYQGVYDKVYQNVKDTIKAQLEAMGLTGEALNTQLEASMESDSVKDQINQIMDSDETKKTISDETLKEENKLDKTLLVMTLESNTSYVSYKMNSQKVQDLSGVFPVFFAGIAGLVTLTTITRMIEEERMSIGTLKALGYSRSSITAKYMCYSFFACLVGTLLGIAVGIYFLPQLLYFAYGTVFFTPRFIVGFEWFYIFVSSASMIFAVLLVTYLVCYSTLKEKPSSLMLGKSPKPGKKILLERIPFFWNKLKFKYKSMFKNIFRYKKNLFMMLIGVGGCTALLLVGFGLRDSFSAISEDQYSTYIKYNFIVKSETEIDFSKVGLTGLTSYCPSIDEDTSAYIGDKNIDATIIAGDSTLDNYIGFLDVKDRKVDYSTDSVIITKQIADTLDVKVNDLISLENDDGATAINLKVTGIVQNYLNNYVYMNISKYQEAFNSTLEFNSYLIKGNYDDQSSQDTAISKITSIDGVTGVENIKQTKSMYDYLLNTMNYIVLLLIGFSGALAIVVTYNLTNININERIREIATLKVLGYQKGEVAGYIYRETMFLTVLGSICGLVGGFFLHGYIIKTIESAGLSFSLSISWLSYFFALALSIIFALIVDLIFLPKLNKVKMVESLKSVD